MNIAPETGIELVIERTFDAPIELVWEAWTVGEHMKRWAPNGFIVTEEVQDFRIGGFWKSTMVSEEWGSHTSQGYYEVIEPPTKLVFSHAWHEEDGSIREANKCTVELIDLGGATKMRFTHAPMRSEESRDAHAVGWGEAFDNLEAYVVVLKEARNR